MACVHRHRKHTLTNPNDEVSPRQFLSSDAELPRPILRAHQEQQFSVDRGSFPETQPEHGLTPRPHSPPNLRRRGALWRSPAQPGQSGAGAGGAHPPRGAPEPASGATGPRRTHLPRTRPAVTTTAPAPPP